MHTESLVLESFLDPSPNLPNILNPNHVLNTLISPGYLLINAHLRHIAKNHNHWSISVILLFISQNSRWQKEPTRWRTSLKNSSSSCLKTTSKTLMRKWRKCQTTSKQCLQYSQIILSNQIRLALCHPHQLRRIHRLLQTLPPWFQLKGGLHHWKGDTLPKFVACGPSNMRSAHQNYMRSSWR